MRRAGGWGVFVKKAFSIIKVMILKQTKDAIPRDGGPDQCDWLDNAILRMNEHAAVLGVVAADKSKFLDWCTMCKDACTGLSNAQTTENSWRQFRQDLLYGTNVDSTPLARPVDNTVVSPLFAEPLLPGAMARIRDFLQTLKRKQAWNAAIEADFRLTRLVSEVEVGPAKPSAKAKPTAGAVVECSWKRGPFDAIVIEWKLANGSTWNSLGTILGSRYTHTAPLAVAGQPEVRHYRFRYVLNNAQVGEWSDLLSVTMKP